MRHNRSFRKLRGIAATYPTAARVSCDAVLVSHR
jgi:hypothetical protein